MGNLWAIAAGVVAGLANLLGGVALIGRRWPEAYLRSFLALGAGFMLAATLLEVLPESLKLDPVHAPLLIVAGYLLIHLVEHAFVPHFHFGEETHAHAFNHAHLPYSVLIGLGVHTFFDGVAIGSGFLVSSWLGGVIFVAVFMHKIPEGFTIASVMLAAGKGKAVALGSAAAIGAASLAGVVVMLLFPVSLPRALPVAAGVTLYVATSDLIPEVNREPGIAKALYVFLGVAILAGLQWVFRGTV